MRKGNSVKASDAYPRFRNFALITAPPMPDTEEREKTGQKRSDCFGREERDSGQKLEAADCCYQVSRPLLP